MLRAFMLLLSIVADYETWADVARYAFLVAAVNASALGWVGACLAVRHWLATRNRENAWAVRRMGSSSRSYSL